MKEEGRGFGDGFVAMKVVEGVPLNVVPTGHLDQMAVTRCFHGEQEGPFYHPFRPGKFGCSSSAELTSTLFLCHHTQRFRGLEGGSGSSLALWM